MSQDISDVQSDVDCEELVDESFRFSEDFMKKKSGFKRTAKPPPSPKSPYLASLNVNPRRAAVAAWRLPRASLGGSREGTPGERESGPGRPTSLCIGHDSSPMLRAECAVSPELFRKNLRKQQKFLQYAANGADFRDKEDMHEEIIHLKKSLHDQKRDNRQMKAKVRRLEEDLAKRERQLEELLDPTNGAEFIRSLVDDKRGSSVVVNGLKLRVLKLEQQCREKESALSKLQSDLRTTNLEELKITVENYFEEIQKLRILLDAAEKRYAADCKTWQRQQRALNTTVQRLSERSHLLLQENQKLSEELSIMPPAAGLSGYKKWSKEKLLRRVLELERLEERQRPAPSQKRVVLLDQQVQTEACELLRGAMATEAGISVATMTEEEEERAELQEALKRRDEELAQMKTEMERHEREMEEWRAKQTSERDKENQQHRQDMELLWTKLQTLEEERERAQILQDPDLDSGHVSSERDTGDRERAAQIIQRQWRKHRDKDVVLLQSALRGHLHRDAEIKAAERTQCGDGDHQTNGLLDLTSLVLIQSAFRAHLMRSGHVLTSSGLWESLGVGSSSQKGPNLDAGSAVPLSQLNLHSVTAAAAGGDSDDSDDIIVSPSRPIRKKEVPVT